MALTTEASATQQQQTPLQQLLDLHLNALRVKGYSDYTVEASPQLRFSSRSSPTPFRILLERPNPATPYSQGCPRICDDFKATRTVQINHVVVHCPFVSPLLGSVRSHFLDPGRAFNFD